MSSARVRFAYWDRFHVELRAEAGFSVRLAQTGLSLREISPADELTHHRGLTYPRPITEEGGITGGRHTHVLTEHGPRDLTWSKS